MKEGLKIQVPSDIVMFNFYRLPQKPLFNNEGQRISRPVIIKLTSVADQRLIFSLTKKLKAHNDLRRQENLRPQYVTEHLPKKFQKLLPAFREARVQGHKTLWRAEAGQCALYVNNVRVRFPPS